MSRYKHHLAHYCSVYGKGIATIKRYSGAGAPLDNPDAMGDWIAAKRVKGGPKSHTPDTFAEDPYPRPQPVDGAEDEPQVFEELKEGAAETLKRLEALEPMLYQRLQKAIRINNAEKIANARADWLPVSESLRKYDLLVEQSRRDSGDLIPRSQGEMAALMAATWLRLAWMTFVSSDASKLQAIEDTREWTAAAHEGMRSAILVALRNSAAAIGELPDWAIAKIKEGFNVS